MHPLLGLSSLLIVVLGSYAGLSGLAHVRDWSLRRDVQLAILTAPVVSLGLGLLALHHFTGRVCFLGAPPWDYRLGVLLPLVMTLVALAGLGLGLVRMVLMYCVVARRGVPAGAEMRSRTACLADRLGVPRPRVRLVPHDRPLAITYGLRSPTVLLSSWMVAHLDRHELEAVIAHELGHVVRRDFLVVWLATLLRDAFAYLPTSHTAYQGLQREKEIACDEIAVVATSRPLALASALGKVWQRSLGGPPAGVAQALMGTGGPVADRLERLLALPETAARAPRPRLTGIGVGASALAALLALQAVNFSVLLTPMGCGPTSPVGRLLSF